MRAIVVDLETGGLDPSIHPITQIAAIGIDLDLLVPIERFERKVQFRKENAQAQALSLNSYNEEVWARDAVHPVKAAEEFVDFIKSFSDVTKRSENTGREYQVALALAYNAEFDIRFLHAWFKRLNKFCPIEYGGLCVLQRTKWFVVESGGVLGSPESYKLPDVCKWLDIEHRDAHDAIGDCEAALDVYRRIRNG